MHPWPGKLGLAASSICIPWKVRSQIPKRRVNEHLLFSIAFVGVIGLLGIGFYGLMVCRNLIKIVIALQILVKAALLGLMAAGNLNGQINLSQSMALTVIVADTIVAVMGIALGVQIRRRVGTLDVRELSRLKG